MTAFAPSREELAELGRGDGEWENIQGLEQELAAKSRESERQKQHLEKLTQTLNVVSEELRREKEEMQEHLHAADHQSEALCERVEMLEQLLARTTEAVNSDCLPTSVAKVEHRLELLEDELGHVIEAVERKADVEMLEGRLVSQKRAVQEALRKRCKTLVVERELLALRHQLEAGLGESCQELSAKIAQARHEFAASESAALASVAKTVDSKLDHIRVEVESGVKSRIADLIARVSAAEGEARAANIAAATAARKALEQPVVESPKASEDIAQLRQRLNELAEAEQQARFELQAKWDSISSKLHAAVAHLEASYRGLKQEIEVINKLTNELVGSEQLQAMETRLTESHRDASIEMQLQLSDALDKMNSGKSESISYRRDQSERLKAMKHQLQEVDHVTRLIGKQLVRTVSQLQVLWEERRAQLEAAVNADESLPDDSLSVGVVTILTASGEGQDRHHKVAENQDDHDQEDADGSDGDLAKLRSEHNALQTQVNEKLQHYQSLLQLGH